MRSSNETNNSSNSNSNSNNNNGTKFPLIFTKKSSTTDQFTGSRGGGVGVGVGGVGLTTTRSDQIAMTTLPTTSSSSNLGIINPVFIDHPDPTPTTPTTTTLVREETAAEVEAEEDFPPPPPLTTTVTTAILQQKNNHHNINNHNRRETVDRTDSASSVSNESASTIITNASSTGGLLPPNNNHHRHNHQGINNHNNNNSNNHNKNIVVGHHRSSSMIINECAECIQFHENRHRVFVHRRPIYLPGTTSAAVFPTTTSTIATSNTTATNFPNFPSPYAPYPPQWYYLLAADTKQFRKHRHTHYRRDCRQCREIVRSTFEQYYLRSGQFYNPTTPTTTTRPTMSQQRIQRSIGTEDTPDTIRGDDSVGEISLDPSQHQLDLQQQPTGRFSSSFPFISNDPMMNDGGGGGGYGSSPLSISPLPGYYYHSNRSRASCGHSCLKYTILFYCCVAIIMSICSICYLTKMFGFMSSSSTTLMTPIGGDDLYYNNRNGTQYYPFSDNNNNSSLIDASNYSIDSNQTWFDLTMADPNNDNYGVLNGDPEQPAKTLLETIRAEMIGLLISSSFMIIFILGLIGAFLESILCLRIFGAILSYLFLLTFGSALYVVILLIISHVSLKLILSTISCAAVAITIHGLLAIAPFAFADLINEERIEEQTEMNGGGGGGMVGGGGGNCTYFKYPSVRFMPAPPSFAPLPPPPPVPPKRRTSRSLSYGLTHFNGNNNNNNDDGEISPSTATPSNSQQTFYRDTPIQSIPTTSDGSLPRNQEQEIDHHHHEMDNSSCEELIPETCQSILQMSNNHNETRAKSTTSLHHSGISQPTVRFTDNWM